MKILLHSRPCKLQETTSSKTKTNKRKTGLWSGFNLITLSLGIRGKSQRLLSEPTAANWRRFFKKTL